MSPRLHLLPYIVDHPSGVVAYQPLKHGIILQFITGELYLYTDEVPGKLHVQKMKQLAKAGSDLSTYRSQHVDDYLIKWKAGDKIPAVVLPFLRAEG